MNSRPNLLSSRATAPGLPAARLATRLAFLVAGFGVACWAPLVPFAKQRLGVDDGVLGLLLLCIGFGSVIAMVVMGALSARYGAKPIIVAGGSGLALVLPLLTIASTPLTLGIALLAFGAFLGSLDVAMNIHAVDVERAEARPLMSGFRALLDWSALLVTGTGLVSAAHGGLGYIFFSIAMTAGRFGGDALTARIGDRATMFWEGLLATVGFVVLLTAPTAPLAMSGFVLIGLGASNVVPVLFRRAGSQCAMPSTLAVAAITTTGYAGHLAGPAGVGFIAKAVGLPTAFWVLAAMFCLVPACAHMATRRLPQDCS